MQNFGEGNGSHAYKQQPQSWKIVRVWDKWWIMID